MLCPNCGAETPDQEWNCLSCRMNVYWASQHYEHLSTLRREQGLREAASTPPFLVEAHKSAMGERPNQRVEHKVRQVARLAMRRQL